MDTTNFDEKDILNLILEEIKMGWWTKDDRKTVITISDFVKDAFGITTRILPYEEFIGMVREDYRDRIQTELRISDTEKLFDQVFPFQTPNGLLWLHAKEVKNQKEDGFIFSTGHLQFIENPEVTSPEKASSLRTNNLLYQLNSISQILLSFLATNDPDKVIHEILKDILKQFKAGRTYIFEYDWEKEHQTCTYEVVDDNVKPEIEILFQLPFETTTWWSQHISEGKPVILSTLDDLPEEAAPEREFLAYQDVNSLFVVPLISKTGVWGYAGVDIVDGFHTWTKEDTEWMIALFNIVSLCIQLQRSEQEAQLDKTYLQNLYNNMPMGYIRANLLYDENGRLIDYIFVAVNDTAVQLFQEPLNDYIGIKASHTPSGANALPLLEQALRSEHYIESDFYIRKSKRFTRLIMYSVQKDEVICLISDITESEKNKQKLIEAKEKAEISDRLKSAFLANMSHEIRTPLNAIIGFSELLVDMEEKAEREHYFQIVHKNNDLLLQLISDILDLSKIEAGTLDILNDSVDVNKLFTEVLHGYQLKTEHNPVQITLGHSMPTCIIRSDKNRLTQILNNFINNALKFSTQGEITIGYYLEHPNHLRFYVKDNGTGISPEDLESIFHRFIKLDHFVAGTGLGLSICKNLVEQMQGTIGVESKLGEGSVFWFTLPYPSNP